ncbi:universal stress protein [Desulfobacca acetoxidans]|uniref:UspA domain-containing protein n=1 Tax=Desulfobacca acetoxidans (strain ATCC 700848 / DSM 11109 / ASRB2) TaxID=880072 RepID=F2NIG3_DESAR|nr:universal stress protein [Desulfobacca acetoxidans]AEB10365.1 UspA domain-containing protein [Desulfobacca acetoxidans DSM 11109]
MEICSYPLNRILIPYDGSPSAKKAVEWAACLAQIGSDSVEKVTLLRVIGGGYLARHIQNVDLRVTRMDQVAAWRRIRQYHLDHEIMPLLEEGKRFLQEKGVSVPIETRVAEGKIGEEISRLADEGGYSAIVMGRRGLSPVKELFLGSVTRQVLSLAQKKTVFVVGLEAVFNPDCPISPLLLPVDGSEPSREAVRQGAVLAQGLRACQPRLNLLYVMEIVQITASMNEANVLVRDGEKILADSHAILLEAGFPGEVEERLQVGEPPRIIAEEAEEGSYALVLMGARGLSSLKQLILGSVSSGVLHRVSRSVIGIVYL